MASAPQSSGDIVHFLRARDYKLIKELGSGACGKTVLLRDDQIDEYFVCKKYCPLTEAYRPILFNKFVQEIKLLHQVHHKNVVRVFNYYLYPEKFSGYILMEYVEGADLGDYAAQRPDQLGTLFVQAVDGFAYLQSVGILHRDIRPGNLLVSRSGQLKIIDLGFGKQVDTSADFEKSITLNWWCQPPKEFLLKRYDFTTEVYFLGKLFERLIVDNNVSQFKHLEIVQRMCREDSAERIKSFTEIDQLIRSNRFDEIDFTEEEIETYREFAFGLTTLTTKIAQSAKYQTDVSKITSQLGEIYRSAMLEQWIPDSYRIIGCFVDGPYYYKPRSSIGTEIVKRFLKMLKSCSAEQASIIIANLHSRLNEINRYDPDEIQDEDIPF